LLDAHPEVVMACGRQITFHTDEPPAATDTDEYRQAIVSGAEFLEASSAAAGNLVATPTVVVRTALQQRLGGYRVELPHTGDMEMWMRFAAHGSIGVVDADQALKRMHGQNMQEIYLATALGDIRQRQAAFTVLFRDWGHLIPERARLERLAVRSLAEDAFWLGSREFDGGDTRRCQEFLDFALELCPELNTRPEWRRLRWKRRLGATTWSWLRPCVNLVRGRGEKTLPAAGTSQTPAWLPAERWQRWTSRELKSVS